MIQRFSFVGCMRKSGRKQKYINTSQTVSSISNQFQKLSVLLILKKYPKEVLNFGPTKYTREKILDQRYFPREMISDRRRHNGTITLDPRYSGWHEPHGI